MSFIKVSVSPQPQDNYADPKEGTFIFLICNILLFIPQSLIKVCGRPRRKKNYLQSVLSAWIIEFLGFDIEYLRLAGVFKRPNITSQHIQEPQIKSETIGTEITNR